MLNLRVRTEGGEQLVASETRGVFGLIAKRGRNVILIEAHLEQQRAAVFALIFCGLNVCNTRRVSK